jgi:Uma2 family endonuclease
MTAMTVMPREPAEWTVDDLDHLPDDGLQYELLDGILLVSPAPIVRHQVVAANLHLLLAPRCPDDLQVLFAPLDWQPDRRTSLQPDLLVARRVDIEEQTLTKPLVLAVEILSPSSARKDAVLKRSKYQDAGVAHYWIVDPTEPSVLALDLIDGVYRTAGQATGDESIALTRPFPVTIVPSALLG